MKYLITLASLLSILSVNSAEIDSYTNRGTLLKKDSAPLINKRVNQSLDNAVMTLNDDYPYCPSSAKKAKKVFKIVKKEISSPFIGHLIAVNLDESLEDGQRIYTSYEESIYQDTTYFQGVSLKLKGILSTMDLKGHIVGVDKIGHFFVEGWGFYKRAYLKSKTGDFERAIDWGRFTEKTYFGLTTTGIFSHADLIANFNGMRFWNRLLSFEKDVLANKKLPAYLSCNKGVWSKTQAFKIEEYIDAAWDEGVNCNYYNSENIENHVTEKIKKSFTVKNFFFNDFRYCPVRLNSCKRVVKKYGEFSKDLIHPVCIND